MIPNSILKVLSVMNPNININAFQNVSTPDEMAQLLLNSGRVNQQMVNQAKQMWNKPDIRQMVQNKFRF